jgi:hypothetical protein
MRCYRRYRSNRQCFRAMSEVWSRAREGDPCRHDAVEIRLGTSARRAGIGGEKCAVTCDCESARPTAAGRCIPCSAGVIDSRDRDSAQRRHPHHRSTVPRRAETASPRRRWLLANTLAKSWAPESTGLFVDDTVSVT